MMASLDGLTYCTNVHPGETLADVERALATWVAPVKARVAPDRSFNVGLRLSARAAEELDTPEAFERFRAALEDQNLHTTTFNGFPYGAFHGRVIKEEVYRPDWQESARLEYTKKLADVLVRLLPDSKMGSISTVPGCFGPRAQAPSPRSMALALLEAIVHLAQLERLHGKRIVLALEPEPSCFLETTAQTIEFFESELWSQRACEQVARSLGCDVSEGEHLIRRHLGVCLDTCHASVEFDGPLAAYRALEAAGIVVAKIQVSAGLRLENPTRDQLDALRRYDEPVYLHQVVVRRDDALTRHLDIPDALRSEPAGPGEWRVHFHVPVFRADLGAFDSTQHDLVELLGDLGRHGDAVQLEVETYTWDVLPPELRERPLVDAIAEELNWTRNHWGSRA